MLKVIHAGLHTSVQDGGRVAFAVWVSASQARSICLH